MLTIAIDFDETITRDAELWRQFIDIAKSAGHRVICVTCRRNTMDNREFIKGYCESHFINVPIYFTDLNSKIEHMRARDIHVDIWIDDDPNCIIHGK